MLMPPWFPWVGGDGVSLAELDVLSDSGEVSGERRQVTGRVFRGFVKEPARVAVEVCVETNRHTHSGEKKPRHATSRF